MTKRTNAGDITISDCDGDADFDVELEAALRESLAGELPQSENSSMSIAARTSAGKVVAGLSASTSYDWLHINLLWVDDAHRRHGLGAELLKRALGRASNMGCSACWLETSNPSARAFYEAEGFSVFAQLSNEGQRRPDSHRRWFLRMRFGPADS